MLARAFQNLPQGELLKFLKNVGFKCELTIANEKQVSKRRKSTCQFQSRQLNNTRRDKYVGEALDEDLSKHLASPNDHVLKQKKSRHGTLQKDENKIKVNIKSKALRQEIQQYQDYISRKYFDTLTEQNNEPLLKTNGGSLIVVLKENYIEFHSEENMILAFQSVLRRTVSPLLYFKIHHTTQYRNLLEIIKNIRDGYRFESITNIQHKPFITQGWVFTPIQMHTRNLYPKNGLGSKELTNDETKIKEINLVKQNMSDKQSTFHIFQSKQLQKTEQKHPPIADFKKLKYIHAFHPSYYKVNEVKSNILQTGCIHFQLKTKGKYMKNFNVFEIIADKLFPKNPATLFDIPMIRPLDRRQKLYLGANFPRTDSQISFSTLRDDSQEDKGKMKCKKSSYTKFPEICKKKFKKKDCKILIPSKPKKKSAKKCKPKKKAKQKCPEEHLTETCVPKKKKLAAVRTEKSDSCVQPKKTNTCKSKKPKKEDCHVKLTENSMCSQNIHKLCAKVRKMSQSPVGPCSHDCETMIKGCTDVCNDQSCSPMGRNVGQKDKCGQICGHMDDASYDPCKKKSKIAQCKEALKKINEKGNMCYKKMKCAQSKCKPKKKKRTPMPPMCCWLKKTFTKKPKIITGSCDEENEGGRLKICKKESMKTIINNIIYRRKKQC